MATIVFELNAPALDDTTLQTYRTLLMAFADHSDERCIRNDRQAAWQVKGQIEYTLDEAGMAELHELIGTLPFVRMTISCGSAVLPEATMKMSFRIASLAWAGLAPVLAQPEFWLELVAEGGTPGALASSTAPAVIMPGQIYVNGFPLPDHKAERLDDPVEKMVFAEAKTFNTRIRNALTASCITTRAILISLTDEELLEVDNFGPDGLKRVKETLAQDGWSTGSKLVGWRPAEEPHEMPSEQAIFINGVRATDRQVRGLDAFHDDYRFGEYLTGRRDIDAKEYRYRIFLYRTRLASSRLMPGDKVEGWKPFASRDDQRLNDRQWEGLNVKCVDLLAEDSPILAYIRDKRMGAYVGNIIDHSDMINTSRHNLDLTELVDALAPYELTLSPAHAPGHDFRVTGWHPPAN